MKYIYIVIVSLLIASCASSPPTPPAPPPEPDLIISVKNLHDPLEEEVVISSERWDNLPKGLLSKGQYDYYIITKINKNDLKEFTRVWVSAIFPGADPSFTQLKYVDVDGNPATESMHSGGFNIQTQDKALIRGCKLNYTPDYSSILYGTSSSVDWSYSCYRSKSFAGYFQPDEMQYFLENGLKARVSGSADLDLEFSMEEINGHMEKVHEVREGLTNR